MSAFRPRVLSILRGADAGAARDADPALDANAYAVADEIELTLVLKDRGVELGLDGACCDQNMLGGLAIPVAEPGIDLRALIRSEERFSRNAENLAARGIDPAALVDGIEPVSEADLSLLILEHDVTLTTSS